MSTTAGSAGDAAPRGRERLRHAGSGSARSCARQGSRTAMATRATGAKRASRRTHATVGGVEFRAQRREYAQTVCVNAPQRVPQTSMTATGLRQVARQKFRPVSSTAERATVLAQGHVGADDARSLYSPSNTTIPRSYEWMTVRCELSTREDLAFTTTPRDQVQVLTTRLMFQRVAGFAV